VKNVRFIISLLFIVLLAGWSHTGFAQATDTRVKQSLRLLDLGNAREAEFNLRQLVQQEPKNAEAHAGYALALVAMNDIPQALTEAQAAFEIDRRNELVRIARGTVYGKQGRIQDALAEFNQAIKLNDKDIAPLVALSSYYISIDSLKPAEITLYRAQQLNDKDVRSYIGLAELYERQHIPELAISQYQQAMNLDPNDEAVHAKLAGLYLRTRKYNESAEEWLKVIKIDSNYADAYYQIGNLYYLAKQYPVAMKYAQKYAQLRPNDFAGQLLLARTMTESGQYKEALPSLEAVKASLPNQDLKQSAKDSLANQIQLLMARSYFYSHEYPKSLEIYRAANNLNPMDLSYFGTALVVSGDTAGGINMLQKSLVGDSLRTPQQQMETQLAIVNLLYAQKRYAEAGELFAGIAAKNPSVQWYLSAGEAYAAAKKPDLAKQYYEKALAIDPNSLKVRYQMAFDELTSNAASDTAQQAFEKLAEAAKAAGRADTVGLAEGFMGYHEAAHKEWAKSAEHLEIAVKSLEGSKSPFLPNFELLLAQSYHQQHEFAKARHWYEEVLKLDPNNKGAKEGLEYLKGAGAEESPKKGRK